MKITVRGVGTPTTGPLPPVTPVTPVWRGSSPTLPTVGEATTRDLSLEITDTAEGRTALIHYGRFRVACPIVHGDIVSGKLEMVTHVGEGPICAIDSVWVNEKLVYPGTPPTGVEVQVRLGGTITGTPQGISYEQAAFTIISNSTIASMQHPGQALVAVRINLTTSVQIISGNTPKVEVAGRGLYVQNPASMDPWYVWTENPILCLSDAMQRGEYGCGIPPYSGTDWRTVTPPYGSFDAAMIACDQIVTYETLSWRGQTSSNQQLLVSDFDRLQSFKAPARGFKVEIKVRAVAATGININFPCVLRITPDGADIVADAFSASQAPVADADYTFWGIWYDTHGIEKDQLVYLVSLKTAWQASNMKWHHNSLTNKYADGKSQKKNGSWADVNYDHWFRAYEAEQMFRCSLTISERMSIERVVEALLKTCNGRIGWWDGLYRVFLDSEATVAGTISDKPSDAPDLLIIGGTLRMGRAEAEIPNVAIGTWFDVQTWTRPEVKYLSAAVKTGTEQEKILRREDVPLPSGGQLYRLLGTWVLRSARTWRASGGVSQKGIKYAPGDLLTMSCSLFAGTKTVLIDDMRDAPGGTFELSLVEWAASDFLQEPYLAQAVVPTTTTT